MNCRPLTVPATAGGLCTVPIFVLGKCVPWGLPWGCRVYTALPRIPNRCPKWSCRGKRKRKFILKTRKDIFFIRPVLGSRDVAAAAVATAPPPPRRPSSSSPSSSGRRPSRKSETFFSNRNGEKSSSFFNREDSFSVACFGERKPFDLPQIIFVVAFQERVRELKLACVICISFFFLCLPPFATSKNRPTLFNSICAHFAPSYRGCYRQLSQFVPGKEFNRTFCGRRLPSPSQSSGPRAPQHDRPSRRQKLCQERRRPPPWPFPAFFHQAARGLLRKHGESKKSTQTLFVGFILSLFLFLSQNEGVERFMSSCALARTKGD